MGGGLPPFMPLFRMDATGNGEVIIDSGTSVARLVESAYTAMREAFRAWTGNMKSAGGFSLFDTCYDLSGLKTVKVPTVVFHFHCRADVSLPATNYLIPVDCIIVLQFSALAFLETLVGSPLLTTSRSKGTV